MWTKADALPVLEVDQDLLRHLLRSGSTPQKLALRARILLGAAEGTSNHQLSEELNVSRPTILLWRQRYLEAGLAGVLKDAPRPGRKKMITPEEVIGDEVLGELLGQHRPAAMFDRGKSEWLRSFAQEHLGRCQHYQLLFYDQLLDVIAEGVEVGRGGFQGAS